MGGVCNLTSLVCGQHLISCMDVAGGGGGGGVGGGGCNCTRAFVGCLASGGCANAELAAELADQCAIMGCSSADCGLGLLRGFADGGTMCAILQVDCGRGFLACLESGETCRCSAELARCLLREDCPAERKETLDSLRPFCAAYGCSPAECGGCASTCNTTEVGCTVAYLACGGSGVNASAIPEQVQSQMAALLALLETAFGGGGAGLGAGDLTPGLNSTLFNSTLFVEELIRGMQLGMGGVLGDGCECAGAYYTCMDDAGCITPEVCPLHPTPHTLHPAMIMSKVAARD